MAGLVNVGLCLSLSMGNLSYVHFKENCYSVKHLKKNVESEIAHVNFKIYWLIL